MGSGDRAKWQTDTRSHEHGLNHAIGSLICGVNLQKERVALVHSESKRAVTQSVMNNKVYHARDYE